MWLPGEIRAVLRFALRGDNLHEFLVTTKYKRPKETMRWNGFLI